MNFMIQADEALAAGDAATAITFISKAILDTPTSPDYYIKRAITYMRLSPPDHASSLSDSEIAVVLSNRRAKREKIAQSQLRRGIALYGLERWADARQCIQWAKKLDPKDKTASIWEMKAANKLQTLDEGDSRRNATVQETPDVHIPQPDSANSTNAKGNGETGGAATASTNPPQLATGLQTPASKIRHDWYQSHDIVTLTVFAKGVPKDKASININESSLEMSFPLSTGADFDFSLDPLFAKINPATSTAKVMSTKVEFLLQKAQPGLRWASLEGTEPAKSADKDMTNKTNEAMKRAVLADRTTNSAPSYPTSSRSGPKNWDKVAADLTRKPAKEKDDGDGEGGVDDTAMQVDEDDDGEGDPVNGFFKKLYKNADPDTRRAMMKSYQESNGTALSTNWSDVGKGPVETSPPDGMEARTWGT